MFVCFLRLQVDKKEVSKIKESDYSNQEPEQKKSFSKRKIISNWAKYDEGVQSSFIFLVSVYIYMYMHRSICIYSVT